ncbi:hypothetical protein QYE76_009255 [Lolium multiflorum]|uniref:Uncharacterized protein n=1 Tax=Lolium multiflorum TaxID=4521 RepID=A0AAD8TUQ3_LOLMU|nr:hypothetical protein QYE76_009255 [Lolium multiflorum]
MSSRSLLVRRCCVQRRGCREGRVQRRVLPLWRVQCALTAQLACTGRSGHVRGWPMLASRVPGLGMGVSRRCWRCSVTWSKVRERARDHGAPSINFNQFLEKEKLKSNGSNFTDWFRHVSIFLTGGNLQYVLDAPLGAPPVETAPDEVKNVYQTRKTQYSQVQCAIMSSLEAELQNHFEHHDPYELVQGSSVSEHVLKMSGHAKKLSDLEIVIPNQLGIHCVLQSLPPSYKNFVMNYNMQNMNKKLPELFSMLKSVEVEIQKEHQVLMVNKATSFKKQGKPNNKGNFEKGGKKADAPPKKPKAGPKPDTVCYYSKYLADLKSGLAKKKGTAE